MLAKIQMTRISFTNQLYGDEAAKKSARVKARFVNNAMMATALGAIVSDGLEDGRVVSGVGGQYQFRRAGIRAARRAFDPGDQRDARRSARRPSRTCAGPTAITTIPRHLRDIVVSEYGIADLRGKSDEHVVAAMLAITDSRFQDELLRRAKDAGKIAKTYEIPAAHRDNHPERIAVALAPLRERGLLPAFPFGTRFHARRATLDPGAGASPERAPLQNWCVWRLPGSAARAESSGRGWDWIGPPSTERLYRALRAAGL